MARKVRRIVNGALAALAMPLVLVTYAPQVLAFPYKARFGDTVVRSERPLPPDFARTIGAADALVAKSALYRGPVPRSIFLTTGGWRWRLVALQAHGVIGLRRPLRNLILINDADPAADRARNTQVIGNVRTLHDTIAHETTHILITDHFGTIRAAGFPTWKVEGYADYVAGASSLNDAQVEQARRQYPSHPAIAYHDARKKVEAALARDPSVDHLFAS